jgi:hypothetical protein
MGVRARKREQDRSTRQHTPTRPCMPSPSIAHVCGCARCAGLRRSCGLRRSWRPACPSVCTCTCSPSSSAAPACGAPTSWSCACRSPSLVCVEVDCVCVLGMGLARHSMCMQCVGSGACCFLALRVVLQAYVCLAVSCTTLLTRACVGPVRAVGGLTPHPRTPTPPHPTPAARTVRCHERCPCCRRWCDPTACPTQCTPVRPRPCLTSRAPTRTSRSTRCVPSPSTRPLIYSFSPSPPPPPLPPPPSPALAASTRMLFVPAVFCTVLCFTVPYCPVQCFAVLCCVVLCCLESAPPRCVGRVVVVSVPSSHPTSAHSAAFVCACTCPVHRLDVNSRADGPVQRQHQRPHSGHHRVGGAGGPVLPPSALDRPRRRPKEAVRRRAVRGRAGAVPCRVVWCGAFVAVRCGVLSP